jgi:hypothetical protein
MPLLAAKLEVRLTPLCFGRSAELRLWIAPHNEQTEKD